MSAKSCSYIIIRVFCIFDMQLFCSSSTGNMSSTNKDTVKRKYPSCFKNVAEYFVEYTENASVHGVKYIGEPRRSVIEKIWWVIVFMISLNMCGLLIMKTYIKWDKSPVIISQDEKPTPIWDIPFPAVTFCSEIKTKSELFNYTYYYNRIYEENVTQEEAKKFLTMGLICSKDYAYYKLPINEDVDINETNMNFLHEVSSSLGDVVLESEFHNEKSIRTLFRPTLTEEGICYTFNMLDLKDIYTDKVYLYNQTYSNLFNNSSWVMDKGYMPKSGFQTFPRRTIAARSDDFALWLMLKSVKSDKDYICQGPAEGFKMILHHPAQEPTFSRNQYYKLPVNKDIYVTITPHLMTTSRSLRSYDAERRKCYFSHERTLQFYRNYTQQNCEIECLRNYILKKCNCVPFYMPKNKTTPICNLAKSDCIKQARENLTLTIAEEEEEMNVDDEDKQMILECNCLPDCISLTYDAEITQVNFNWVAFLKAIKFNITEFSKYDPTEVTAYFKAPYFFKMKRKEMFGLTDFLANCGGLLGLFIGFSLLSVVEILYFISFRLCCNIKRYGVHLWSGSPKLIDDLHKIV